jgi:hypothetical protein
MKEEIKEETTPSEFGVAADSLNFIQQARVSAQVRQTHLGKKGRKCNLTEEILGKTGELEKWLNGIIRRFVQKHLARTWFSQVKGVGDLNVGKVVSLIDIQKAPTVSSLWKFAGFAVDEHGKAERRIRGQKLHYNKTLKAMCWRLAKSLIRAKGKYYEYYVQQKKALIEKYSRQGLQVIPSAELPEENGKKVEKDGKIGLGHVDMMAMRKMIKLFLSHLWLKWREAEGLPVASPYAHAIQGHSDYRSPEEFIN